MKKILLFALLATLAFSGCKKDDDNKPSYTGDITINGTKTTFSEMVYGDTGEEYLIIGASGTSTSNMISLSIGNPVIGDVNFSESVSITVIIGGKNYSSKTGAGKITIKTKDSKSISGSFSGTFQDEDDKDVTNVTGNFSAVEGTAAE